MPTTPTSPETVRQLINNYLTLIGNTKLTVEQLRTVLNTIVDGYPNNNESLTARKYAGVSWYAGGTSITDYEMYTAPLAVLSGMTLTNLAHAGGTISGFQPNETGQIYDDLINGLPTSATAKPLITIESPINDFRLNANLGVLGDTIPNSYYGGLFRTIRDCYVKLPKAQIVLIADYGNTDTNFQGRWDVANQSGLYLGDFVNAMKRVAAMFGVPVIDLGAYNIGGPNLIRYSDDGIHPNTAGGIKIATDIWNFLQTLDRDPATPVQGTFSLGTASANNLGGTGLTVNGINPDSTIDYTLDPAFSFASLWLASGANNAVEFTVASKAGQTGFWITYGEGPLGFSGVGTTGSDTLAYRFTTNGSFAAANGGVNITGFSQPDYNANTVLIDVGDVFRMHRVGTVVTLEKKVSEGWTLVLRNDLIEQTGLTSDYYSTPRLGLLRTADAFIEIKTVKIGIYTP